MGSFTDVFFWRQCLVLIGSCMLSIGTGFMLSFPAVLNPDILSPNSTISVTPEQASWIAGINGISGLVGFCVSPYIMKAYGRKSVNIGMNFCNVFGFLIFSLANNVYCLYAARLMQGLKMCATYLSAMILAEYSHPKRRGYFVTIKKSMVPIGALMCHSLGMCWTWKQIATFAIFPNVLAAFITFLWPESPSYLALTGKYGDCEKSHRYVFGDNTKRERELEDLISAQMEARKQRNNKENLRDVFRKLLKKEFVKPFVIASLLIIIIDASGKFYMLAYVVQILTEVTNNKSIAVYCTLGSDILTLAALLISITVIRCYNRRAVLFSFGAACVFLMSLISLVTFLKTRYNIGKAIFWWFAPSLILLNVYVVNVGIVPVSSAIMCEIFPLEHKGTGTCASGIIFTFLFFVVMKFTPIMMKKTGVGGTFGIYAVFVAVGLSVLYFILNETKDKTLLEIEKEMRGVKKATCNFNEYYLNDKPLIES